MLHVKEQLMKIENILSRGANCSLQDEVGILSERSSAIQIKWHIINRLQLESGPFVPML